jgi:hypothetical protein
VLYCTRTTFTDYLHPVLIASRSNMVRPELSEPLPIRPRLPSRALKLTLSFGLPVCDAVAAGENMALATLTNVLNYIKVQKINMKKLQAELTEEQLRGKVSPKLIPSAAGTTRVRRLPSVLASLLTLRGALLGFISFLTLWTSRWRPLRPRPRRTALSSSSVASVRPSSPHPLLTRERCELTSCS